MRKVVIYSAMPTTPAAPAPQNSNTPVTPGASSGVQAQPAQAQQVNQPTTTPAIELAAVNTSHDRELLVAGLAMDQLTEDVQKMGVQALADSIAAGLMATRMPREMALNIARETAEAMVDRLSAAFQVQFENKLPEPLPESNTLVPAQPQIQVKKAEEQEPGAILNFADAAQKLQAEEEERVAARVAA